MIVEVDRPGAGSVQGAVVSSRANPGPVRTGRRWYGRSGKRVFDLSVALLGLLLLAPLFGGIALGLRVSVGRGVILRQRRVGLNGADFEMYKFRTMRPCRRVTQRPFDGPDRRSTHKHVDDPRHTRLGRLLRRSSLDELPQLLNVLRGDMSIVGPRPEMSDIVDKMRERQHPRHQVRPGLTGVFQTTVRNSGGLLHEHFDLDLPYVANVSMANDLRIIAGTVRVVFAARGH